MTGIESMFKAVGDAATKNLENLGRNIVNRFSDVSSKEEDVTDDVLEARVDAAAHCAGQFFDLPEAKIQKGEAIGVYKNGEGTLLDDVFQYNLDQFKEMDCTSFGDMTKVWSHECGHRLLQNIFPNSWADELGADFFVGVRSEMMGLPKSNFEKTLKSTTASKLHPDGTMRMKAMDYGRSVVTQMKQEGIQPTWENCIEAYKQSPFANMTYENMGDNKNISFTGLHDISGYLRDAAKYKEKAENCLNESKRYANRGDLKRAAEMAKSAEEYRKKAEDKKKDADRFAK